MTVFFNYPRASADVQSTPPYETRWLYCAECPQYSIRLEGYLFTSCLLSAFEDAYSVTSCD